MFPEDPAGLNAVDCLKPFRARPPLA